MTRDDIIRLYEKANWWTPDGFDKTINELERFAELVAAEEREACAEVCELMYDYGWLDAKRCAKEIRARGRQ